MTTQHNCLATGPTSDDHIKIINDGVKRAGKWASGRVNEHRLTIAATGVVNYVKEVAK